MQFDESLQIQPAMGRVAQRAEVETYDRCCLRALAERRGLHRARLSESPRARRHVWKTEPPLHPAAACFRSEQLCLLDFPVFSDGIAVAEAIFAMKHLLSSLSVAVFLLAHDAFGADTANTARVTSVEGRVTFAASPAAQFAPLTAGTELPTGARVRTGSGRDSAHCRGERRGYPRFGEFGGDH